MNEQHQEVCIISLQPFAMLLKITFRYEAAAVANAAAATTAVCVSHAYTNTNIVKVMKPHNWICVLLLLMENLPFSFSLCGILFHSFSAILLLRKKRKKKYTNNIITSSNSSSSISLDFEWRNECENFSLSLHFLFRFLRNFLFRFLRHWCGKNTYRICSAYKSKGKTFYMKNEQKKKK